HDDTRTTITGAGAATCGCDLLSGALAEQHDLDRVEKDEEIQEQRVVLDVVEVVLQLGACILDRRAIRIAHLRPAGDTRLHAVAYVVVGNVLDQVAHEERALGARADETQVAAQDVDELRQLVDSRAPQEPAYRGDAR